LLTIATTTGLEANFENDFSFGFTLDVTTHGISGNKRDVSRSSLQLTEKAYIRAAVERLSAARKLLYHSLWKISIRTKFQHQQTMVHRIMARIPDFPKKNGAATSSPAQHKDPVSSSILLPKKHESTLHETSRSKAVYPWPGPQM